jgi:hypothetical protein
MSSPPPSPNAKLERAYTAAKDREKIEIAKSGLQSEAAQGNIAVVLERLLRLDQRVDPRDVPAVYKRALLRFHPDRHVGKPIAKRASYEERYARYIPRKLSRKNQSPNARAQKCECFFSALTNLTNAGTMMNRRSVVAITFSFVAISPFSFVVVVVVVVKSLLKERESST